MNCQTWSMSKQTAVACSTISAVITYCQSRVTVVMSVCGGEAQLLSDSPLESLPVEVEWRISVRPQPSSKRMSHFKTRNALGKNKNMVVSPDGAQNQEWLYWRGPAAARLAHPWLSAARAIAGLPFYYILIHNNSTAFHFLLHHSLLLSGQTL
jgi:hypothetical protein